MSITPALRPLNRLFVAADLDPELRERLAAIGAEVARDGRGRAVPAENLHVTVAFLGTVDPPAWGELATALERALDTPAGRVRIAGVRARPRASAARLVAVDLDDVDGAIGALARRVGDAVGHLGGSPPDRRRFRPHVTVARFRRPARVQGFAPVDGEHVFDITRASLYDSHIAPGRPPRYEALLTVGLGASLAERSSSHG